MYSLLSKKKTTWNICHKNLYTAVRLALTLFDLGSLIMLKLLEILRKMLA